MLQHHRVFAWLDLARLVTPFGGLDRLASQRFHRDLVRFPRRALCPTGGVIAHHHGLKISLGGPW